MSHLTYKDYPGLGEQNAAQHGYHQGVRIGDFIHLSGQGGWDPKTGDFRDTLEEQVEQAFANVDLALKTVGGKGWEKVFRVTTYFTNMTDAVNPMVTAQYRKWMPNHMPLWTNIGVARLGEKKMWVEVEVVAHDPID